MSIDSNTWTPPVAFHFKVVFQWDGLESSASFSEVDGLGQSLTINPASEKDGYILADGVTVENLVLKRAIEPLDEKVTDWIKECFSFLAGGWVQVCNISISLLDEYGDGELARWKCYRAIPVKWSLGPLNASDSKITIETLTLKYCELIREW